MLSAQTVKEYFVPSTVKGINDSAFECYINLSSIHFPASVKLIGKNAFWFCTEAIQIAFCGNIESILGLGLNNCSKLISILIPVNFLDSTAFIGCNALIPIELIQEDVNIGYDLNSLLKYGNKNNNFSPLTIRIFSP